MKITRVDHIGIAVKSIAESLKVYEAMGLKSVGVEEVAEQKVRVAFLPLGEAEIELLESTSPDGPVAKYIEKNGEGIQHLAPARGQPRGGPGGTQGPGSAAHRREAPLWCGRREDRLRASPFHRRRAPRAEREEVTPQETDQEKKKEVKSRDE